MTTDVIAVLEDADASGAVHAARHRLGTWRSLLFDRDIAIDDLERCRPGEFEALDRWHVAQGLVFPLAVVVGDPDVESSLELLDGLEALVGEELLAHRLVQALDLAGRRRRIGRGQEVADPVVETDAVEEHVGGLATETPGEDLAVVGQDLLGDPVGVESFEECVADRPGRRTSNHLGDDAEA